MTAASLESQLGGRSGRRVLGLAWENALAALLPFAFVVSLAAADGGYRPNAWGWLALTACWLSALWLLLATATGIGRYGLVTLSALTALVGWIVVSALWTSSGTKTILEAERAGSYLAVLAVLLVVVRKASVAALVVGTWAAVSLVSLYALGTRIFPERLGSFDPLAGYRLAEPLGYWNALGIFAVIGALLALGLAARSTSWFVRALAAASLVVLLPTQYFTFGRGPWIALGVGLVVAIAVDRRRLQLIASLLVLAPWPALGVWLASRSDALVRTDAPLATASREGHRLAATLVALAAAGALTGLALRALETRVQFAPWVSRAFAAALLVAVIAGLAGVTSRYGSPPTLVRDAYSAFRVPAPAAGADLNARLFDLSGNGRDAEWRAAWKDARLHPWLGSGAGTYEEHWLKLRDVSGHARDAHNLYLEILAELGPLGLLLLGVALGAPFVAGLHARHGALVPAVLGGYAAFLAHALVDWDWEMPAVTVAALCCGAMLLASARREERVSQARARTAGIAAVLVLSGFALVAAVGNSAAAASEDAVLARDWTKAEEQARKAKGWMPWSSEPWRHLGEAQLGRGDSAAARTSFTRALAKDPEDWSLWFDLALVTRGSERARALRRAERLNPLGSEVQQLLEDLGP
jgi:O-antigen ligase/polysaccharide polymerase Wzy-like membrane protein